VTDPRAESDPFRPEAQPSVAARQPALSRRQQSVLAALNRIDEQLGDLFLLGLELSARESQGVSYLIAEAGRELNLGVIRALSASLPELPIEQLRLVPADDKYRGVIARALQLHPNSPVVSAWAEMHRRFNDEAHYAAQRTTPSTA
jgi:hypothetical protein